MSTEAIRVEFLDDCRCEIPVADLMAVCAVGSKYAIRIPVASMETFDHFQIYVNKHKALAQNRDSDDISEWDNEFIEQFRDEKQLKHLAAVAELTQQCALQQLCNKRVADLIHLHEEEEDYRGDDDYDYMEKSPSPDNPEDEDEFWDGYGREDDDLYGEDRESPSP